MYQSSLKGAMSPITSHQQSKQTFDYSEVSVNYKSRGTKLLRGSNRELHSLSSRNETDTVVLTDKIHIYHISKNYELYPYLR